MLLLHTLSQTTGRAHIALTPTYFQPTVMLFVHTCVSYNIARLKLSSHLPMHQQPVLTSRQMQSRVHANAQYIKQQVAACCMLLLHLYTGVCSVRIERIQDTGDTQKPLHPAEIRLFEGTGVQYSRSELSITMSSSHPDLPPKNCLDGDTDTFCHSADTDSNAWLNVAYACKDGLSKVQVVNRRWCCRHTILQYRMRVLSPDGVTDLQYPFTFFINQDMEYDVPFW